MVISEEEKHEEANRIFNEEANAAKRDAETAAYKSVSSFFDKGAAFLDLLIEIGKENKEKIEKFLTPPKPVPQKIEQSKELDDLIDYRVLKTLVASEIVLPEALDAYERARARKGLRREVDVGSEVLGGMGIPAQRGPM